MYLMRHAEVVYFADPARPVEFTRVALTEKGVEQARAAGRALADVDFDRVITSGLQRTQQTAELVLEGHDRGLELERWPELEELRGGSPSQIPEEDLEEAFLSAFRGTPPSDASFLRGETIGSLAERVGAAMDRLYAADDWNTILCVLHGGVNRAVLSWAIGGQGTFFGHFEQTPACINIIDGGPERFVVRTVNFTPYDPVHLGPRSTTLEETLAQYRAYRRAT